MNKELVISKIKAIASEHLLADEDEITFDFRFSKDALFDDLTEIDILMDLEDEYSITFDEDYRITTLKELAETVLKKID